MIYAVNTRTKEHRSWSASFTPAQHAHEWEVVNADADGWIAWPGGDESPLPLSAACDVRHADGEVYENTRPGGPGAIRWRHAGKAGDIIAYRPILDAAEPEAPEWLNAGGTAEVHNEPGHLISCGHSALGREVGVKALFQSGDVDMAAVEFGGECFCFRVDMLRPLRNAEDKAVEEMKAVADMLYVKPEHIEMICRALYRAGYRKTD